VYCYTYCDDYRTTSWVNLIAKGTAGTFTHYTLDGSYAMWLPAGDYQLTITEWSPANEGHRAQTRAIHLSDGQIGQLDFYLEQSNIPIPEMTSPTLVTVALVTATFVLARRRRKTSSL